MQNEHMKDVVPQRLTHGSGRVVFAPTTNRLKRDLPGNRSAKLRGPVTALETHAARWPKPTRMIQLDTGPASIQNDSGLSQGLAASIVAR